ncbi:DUF916 and DUF3324 domain-containing protein [Enterococcus mundtii]|uniref:DUF916 and DUF3324 domain-containing protein n=1 Tax=Enterococcus mundtii TaxID=53346 RepID=UPI001CCFAB0F|nr:DUF916 and DUF3324 domain-containing protein [Enterococcus mundtii]UBM07091.1 DUF916 and DUF3324 domain-containing protein [Enterococcus mundtii]UBM07195.1 DUF916 and DUF3324 domain-containing protein [Enterococcus mundtii]
MKQANTYRINKIQQAGLVLLMVFVSLLAPMRVGAEEGTLNFYVTPEFSDNQKAGNERYFQLTLQPDTTEKLTLKLQNANSEAKKIKITPHTAYTNVMGVVEYGQDAEEADPTLKYSLDELIEQPEIIELAGNETKTVTLDLKMPKEAFEGFLAGGLRIEEVKEKTTEETSDEEGVAIQNEFAYIIGVVVSNKQDAVQPDLDLLDVFADQLNYRNVISANLQNFTPTFVNRLEVEATVQKAGEEEILYQASQEQMQMAPNSNFNFPISLEGDRFRSGEYLLKMTARSGEDEWQWERKFTIEADEARALNRADVTIDSSLNWWIIGAVLMILFLVAILGYVLYKQKKTAQEKVD